MMEMWMEMFRILIKSREMRSRNEAQTCHIRLPGGASRLTPYILPAAIPRGRLILIFNTYP